MAPETDTEVGSIRRELYIDATPEVVYEVVSDPEHVRHWWFDEGTYRPQPGSAGAICFGDPAAGGKSVALTVVEADPPTTFSFRWTHPAEDDATVGNSLLVTFELIPSGGGTRLRFTETGFRELGWDDALWREQLNDHRSGWDHFLPRLVSYAQARVRQI